MSRLNGRKKTVAIAAACLLVAAGAAYAYWTSTGAGTGSATHESYQAITVTQTSTIAGLYPGGPAVTLSGKFDNPNPGPVRVGSVTVAFTETDPTAAIDGSAGSPVCTTADYVLGGSAPVAAEVPAGSAQGSWSGLTIRMVDSGTNQDACKAATVHLTYSSN